MFKKTTSSADYLSTDVLEITFTGPFQTGNPLDFSQTIIKDYKTKQDAVKKRMEKLFSQYNWEIPKWGEGQKYEMGSSGTGKAHTPPFYLECIVGCEEIECKFKKYNFTIKEMKIKFYEFGFATVSISGIISSKDSSEKKEKISSNNLLYVVNDLDEKIKNGKVQRIKEIISEVTEKFDETIKENEIKELFANEKTSHEKANISIGNIISLHRIFRYKVNKNLEIEVAQKAFRQIAKFSNGEWQEENSFFHFVGVANSVIVYNHNVFSNQKSIDGKILNQYIEAYETVLETANAYYFIAEFLKNKISNYSRESVAINESKKVLKIFKNRKISKEVKKGLNNFIILSSNFSSVFDEFIINLNPQGKNIWDRMNKAWNTSKTIQMLKDQLQSSLLITGEIFSQKSNKRQFWLNVIAIIFAVIGVISLVQISQSNIFRTREIFIIQGHTDNFAEFVAEGVNWFGSILAVILVFAVLLILFFAILSLLYSVYIRFFRRRSNR